MVDKNDTLLREVDEELRRERMEKLWEKYGIEAVPTVIAFAKGEIVARADSVPGVGLSKKKWSDFCACL